MSLSPERAATPNRLAGRVLLCVALLVAAGAACRKDPAAVPPAASGAASPPSSGGTFVTSIRAEPKSFNRYVARDLSSEVVALLTHSSLVRIDRATQRLEPDLAEHWDLLPDGVTYRLALRRGLRFSDGEPFSSADVVFSFRAIYETRGDVVMADSLKVHGKPLVVAAEGPDTVTVRFPGPFGPGLRMLSGIPIFPRHRLADRLSAGTFASAWGMATPLSELAGLGPFVARRYEPGQRLFFDRNPYYWRKDGDGRALPSADHVVLEIVPDQDAEQLKMIAGEIDFTQSELRPSDYGPLKQAEAQGRLTLTDLGVGPDGDLLWFNLSAAKKPDARSAWLQHVDFRRAVSHAVDREVFINTVYLGAAVPGYGVVSPGNAMWYADTPAAKFDLAAARANLAGLGLRTGPNGGMLKDAAGAPVRFSLLTQKGNTSLERGATVIRDSLAAIGVQVDVVGLEVNALAQRFTRGDYDAVYFRLLTDVDPSLNPDFWLSSGDAHVWDPAQPSPGTAWEREIDRLMAEVAITADQDRRHARFSEVQQIMARELPALAFAFPRLWFAMSKHIVRATLAPFAPPILWNPAVIAVASTR